MRPVQSNQTDKKLQSQPTDASGQAESGRKILSSIRNWSTWPGIAGRYQTDATLKTIIKNFKNFRMFL